MYFYFIEHANMLLRSISRSLNFSKFLDLLFYLYNIYLNATNYIKMSISAFS